MCNYFSIYLFISNKNDYIAMLNEVNTLIYLISKTKAILIFIKLKEYKISDFVPIIPNPLI